MSVWHEEIEAENRKLRQKVVLYELAITEQERDIELMRKIIAYVIESTTDEDAERVLSDLLEGRDVV